MEHFQITETELWAYISKTADTVTLQKVEKWMNSSNFDEALFAKTTIIYNKTFELSSSVEEAKKKFFEHVATEDKSIPSPWTTIFKYAAIIALIISGVYTYQQLLSNKAQFVIQTTYGEQKEFELPDGSTVWLNASSTLSYHKESPRTLYLEGEAFFDVARDTARPFTVRTSDALKVRALGTSFNVQSYPNSSITETKLLTGKVEVIFNKLLKNKILLAPNEKVIFYRDKKEIVKSRMEGNEHNIAWKEGKIQFKNKVFREIALDLKMQFNIILNFENEEIANTKFTGSFDNTTPISEMLEILKMSKDFNYELNTESNAWIIK